MRNSIGLCCVILACLALQTVNSLSTRQEDRSMSAPDAEQKARDASWNESMAEFQSKAAQLDREFAETRQAAEQGDAAAQYELGRMYAAGHGVRSDMIKAVSCFEEAAAQGHAQAQEALCARYAQESGDVAKTAQWCRKAAEQGLAESQWHLAWMYIRGEGVAQDDAGAVHWFSKAVGQGYVGHLAPYVMPQSDADRVLRLFQRNAEQGQAWAQMLLGLIYGHGDLGVTKDYANALHWFQKAAEQGDVGAQWNTAQVYVQRNDIAKAAYWLEKAAEQGHILAQASLGGMYYAGYADVPQDDAKALHWSQKAAEQGETGSQARLGLMYLAGLGVPQDDAKAAQWFEKAAQSEPGAQIQLGVLYAQGRGVAQDDARAVLLYTQALDLCLKWERILPPAVDERGVPNNEHEGEGMRRYRKTLGQAMALARYHLGEMHLLGRGTPRDPQAGCDLLRQAAEQGSWDAAWHDEAFALYTKSCGAQRDARPDVK